MNSEIFYSCFSYNSWLLFLLPDQLECPGNNIVNGVAE
jgi:hypothetical protein